MNSFTKDYIEFFKDLHGNNNRDWFSSNKKRYEKSVKEPFQQFVKSLIERIDPEHQFQLEPKDCILRINRDIRFSKDKTPYNLYMTAFISPGGRKNKSIPGLFIRISAHEIGIMGGCYGPDKDQLRSIRQHISDNLDEFQSLVFAKEFVSKFGELKGEENKRLPQEFITAIQKEPFIAKKQFYYSTLLDSSLITEESLIDTLMDYYNTMKPMNDFLNKAISSNFAMS